MTHAQPLTNQFHIMMLVDSNAMLDATNAFVRSLAGEGAHLFVVPYACGMVGSAPPAPDIQGLQPDGAPVELLSLGSGRMEVSERVAALAHEHRIDLIVVGTSCDPSGRLQDRCTAAQLALDCPVPVMVLHGEAKTSVPPAPIRRLVVPLDGSSHAAQVLPFTVRLARWLDVPVQLVTVIDPSRILPPAYVYDAEAMDNVLMDLRETAHWALKQAEDWMRREGVTVESTLLFGPLMPSIESTLDQGDIVLITTHGVGRRTTNRLGRIAAQMLECVTMPLVIMRGLTPGEVVVEGYAACPWVEPLSARGGVAAQA